MNVLWMTITVTLSLVAVFLCGYGWAAYSGQFDDLETPAHRALLEEKDHSNE